MLVYLTLNGLNPFVTTIWITALLDSNGFGFFRLMHHPFVSIHHSFSQFKGQMEMWILSLCIKEMYWCENKGGRGSTSELIYINCRCEKKGEDKGKMWRRVGLGGTLNMPPQILIKKIFVQLWFFQKTKY